MDIAVPAQSLITALKHQFRDLITLTVRSNPDEAAAELKQSVLLRLLSVGISIEDPVSGASSPGPDCRFQYGTIYGIEIVRPNDDKDLLVATTCLAVECGDDTSLYVFERHANSWNLAISRESNGYEDVSGAQGNLQYSVSPRDDKGDYFVVSADVSPWCTSNWQEIRYRAERAGKDPASPVIIAGGKDIIFLGDSPPCSITTTPDSLCLEYNGEFHNDTGRMVRRHVLAFHVAGNRAERVAPVADRPEEFVDEWMSMPWELASKWSARDNIGALKTWHEGLQPVGDYASLGDVDFVRPCSDGKWLIGMDVWDGPSFRGNLPDKLYFKVSETDGVYKMQEISASRDASCAEAKSSGDDLSH